MERKRRSEGEEESKKEEGGREERKRRRKERRKENRTEVDFINSEGEKFKVRKKKVMGVKTSLL